MLYISRLVFVLLVVAFLGSYLGALHPLGDSLAVFRMWLGAMASALALLIGGPVKLRMGLAGALGIVALSPLLTSRIVDRAQTEDVVRLYQKNLSFRLSEPQAILQDIASARADIVFLQEVDADNLAVVDALSADFSSSAICSSPRLVGGVAVLSRWPMVNDTQQCVEGDGFVAVQLDSPIGRIWLVSIHWFWPYPHTQSRQAARHAEVLSALDGPVFIGGDFNMVRGSYAMREIMAASRSNRPNPVDPTFHLEGVLPVSIDHILVPDGFTGHIQRREKLGSDHHGLFAIVSPNS